MNLNIGFQLNETITEAVLDQLIAFDPTLAERSRDDIPRTCTNIRMLAAVGSITGLPLFLKIKDFVDRNLLEQNDPNLLNRGMSLSTQECGAGYSAKAHAGASWPRVWRNCAPPPCCRCWKP